MVPRDCVLDHSEVMTALRGYSAPIPELIISSGPWERSKYAGGQADLYP